MPEQLSLQVNLSDAATFDNFLTQGPSSNKEQVVDSLRNHLLPNYQYGYLWGGSGSGVSHLLQASCHQISDGGLSAQYLPLSELLDYPPSLLFEGLEQMELVCLDNIELVLGRPEWELALFEFYNRINNSDTGLLLGAKCAVRELSLQLVDLQSRFSSGPVFHLAVPDDSEKQLILQFRAWRRGMILNDDVARFLIHRAARGMDDLMICLDRLESASLQARRKLSVPFVKQVFDW